MAATIRRYGAQRDEMATIACASELRGCAHTFGWISLWLLLLRFYGVNVVRRCVLFRITFHTHRLFESCTSNKVSGFHGIVFVFLFVIFLTFSFFVVFFAWQTWLANAKPENIWRMVQCSIAIRLDCWAKTNFECVTACVCLCVCVLCWRQHFRSPKQLKWAHAVCVCVCVFLQCALIIYSSIPPNAFYRCRIFIGNNAFDWKASIYWQHSQVFIQMNLSTTHTTHNKSRN